jgi:hypothetical protein
MEYQEVKKKVREIFSRYKIIVNPLKIPSHVVWPRPELDILELIDTDGKDVLIFSTWDDCNFYQEEGYYLKKLSNINTQVENDISITEIREKWDSKGIVYLAFKEDGEEKYLTFDINEEKDSVPEAFTKYIDNLLINYSGESTFFHSYDEAGEYYYLIPNKAIEELDNIPEVDLSKLEWKNKNKKSPYKIKIPLPKDDHPIQEGVVVKHPTFGSGIVNLKEGSGAGTRIQVSFDNGEDKWLVLNYANLQLG